eukprot:scaffold97203_cov48-Phaeocystis_antarctica.AAC.2
MHAAPAAGCARAATVLSARRAHARPPLAATASPPTAHRRPPRAAPIAATPPPPPRAASAPAPQRVGRADPVPPRARHVPRATRRAPPRSSSRGVHGAPHDPGALPRQRLRAR